MLEEVHVGAATQSAGVSNSDFATTRWDLAGRGSQGMRGRRGCTGGCCLLCDNLCWELVKEEGAVNK